MSRLRGPDHGPHAGEAGFGVEPISTLRDELRHSLEQRRVRGGKVEQVRGARIGRAHEAKQPGTRGVGFVEQRLERVPAEHRVGRGGVGSDARDVPPRGRRRSEERLPVCRCADRHVAALAVGDHQQPGVARRRGGEFERHPARRTEPLEAGQLELGRHAGRPSPLDQGAAAFEDGRGGSFSRVPLGRRGLGVER